MKKIGIFLMGLAATLAIIYFVQPTIAEHTNVEALKKEYVAYADEISTEEISEDIETTENVETCKYPWYDNCELGTDVGYISIPSREIETVVGFGGSEDEYIEKKAGIHEQLSNNDSLFILGHHYKSDIVFTRLSSVEVGDTVELVVCGEKYCYTVTDSFYVTSEQYKAENYKICTGNDLTLATCEWENGEKGRQIVICTLN